jgi:hypothetical protein
MASSADWSDRRKLIANGVAYGLYGTTVIMATALAVEPGEFTFTEAALGALVLGGIMLMTRLCVEVVKRETETGSFAGLKELGDILLESGMVVAFPVLTAAMIAMSPALGVGWPALLDAIFYLGALAILLTGFTSRYVLDGRIAPALARGLSWLALGLVLIIARKLI